MLLRITMGEGVGAACGDVVCVVGACDVETVVCVCVCVDGIEELVCGCMLCVASPNFCFTR